MAATFAEKPAAMFLYVTYEVNPLHARPEALGARE